MDEAPEFDNEEEVETEHYVEDRFGVLAKMEMQMKRQLEEARRKKERSEASAYRPSKKPFKHNARRHVQETPEMIDEVEKVMQNALPGTFEDVANEREQKDRSTLYPYYPRSMRPSQMRKRTGATDVTAPSDRFGVVAKRRKIETDKLPTSSLYPYYPSIREVKEKERRNAAEISKNQESVAEERDEKSRKKIHEKNAADVKQGTHDAPSKTMEAVDEREKRNHQSSSHPYYPGRARWMRESENS
ncbi:hypothetical protein CAEBREN_20302 [Caenorhabditis brenneri]|uniref:Uncharacterized protein n=1 Tax=Caenorhabditis brenneri TaxID=135651 RepID=G0NWX5_CAEBE|nr:hypothetical protein CAEBREN_20302 [Caenorhabditis brenneri]